MAADPDRRVLASALPALGLLLFAAMAARYWAYTNDDAYITFRYSAALAEGRGPYYNPGEHVEGYTNFSWMLICAALYRLVGAEAMPHLARVLELGAAGAALLFGGRLALYLSRGAVAGLVALAAVGLAAASPGFAVNSVSGLETGLYALLVCAGAALAVEEAAGGPPYRAAAALALAGLTRPEGALIGGLVWVTLLAMRLSGRTPGAVRAPVLGSAALLFGVSGLHLALRYALYDGEWLPNTFYAKQGGFAGIPPLSYLWAGLNGSLLGLPGLALALLGTILLLRRRPDAAPAVLVAVAGALLPLATGADWMVGCRLVVPYLPVITAVVALGWAELGARAWGWAPGLVLLSVPLSAALQAPEASALVEEVGLRARGYQTGHEAVADWVRARGAPGEARQRASNPVDSPVSARRSA